MVDTISNAKRIRHGGPTVVRYGTPPPSTHGATGSKDVVAVTPSNEPGQQEPNGDQERGASRDHESRTPDPDLRLEIHEDEKGGVVYRFVDRAAGEIVREWGASEFGKLRDYVRAKNIRLLDTKA